VYLTDLRSFPLMNEAYRSFFGQEFPARTTVQSGLMAPTGRVEIMMIAVTR
jgi:enamine deaminase RidA (YjgF/YER057c/UK114 family)